MKKTLLLFCTVFALGAISCTKADKLETPDVSESRLISFSAKGEGLSTSVSTKASAVTSLESFNVTATKGESSETAVFENISFSKSGSNYTGGKYWPSTDAKYHFYAANAHLSFATNVCSVSPSDASKDIIVAHIANPTYKASNELVFEHIYSRIGSIAITAPSGYTISGTPTIALSAPVAGTYSLNSKNWTSKGSAAKQTLVTGVAGASASNDVYVVPGTYSMSVTYTLVKGDYVETFTKTANVTLVQGKVNNITATAPAGNAQEIVFTVTVTPWGTNPINVDLS